VSFFPKKGITATINVRKKINTLSRLFGKPIINKKIGPPRSTKSEPEYSSHFMLSYLII
jgi:hypothetical protein